MADIPRIKRNIQRMIDQNAPEADIDAYVSSEGVSLDDLRAPNPDMERGQAVQDIAAYTGEVLSGDPSRARSAIVQNEYEQMPWYKKAAVATDDIVRLTADGLTSGFVDKVGGKFSEATGIGPTTEERRQNTEDARSRAGWAGTAAEVAGGVYGADKLLKGGQALVRGAGAVSPTIARVAGGAANLASKPGLVGLGARTAGAAATGAGLGALNAAGHDQDIGEGATYGAVFGAGGNLVSEGLSAAGSKVAGLFNKKPQVMTREQLEGAANAAYKAADDAGVILKPTALQRLSKEVQDDLAEFGYTPELQPRVGAFLNRLSEMSQGNVTLKGVDQLRKVAGLMGKSNEPAEREIARQIIKKIDKHLDTLNAGDILAGNKTQGVKALQEARKYWGSAKKTEMIEEAVLRAQNNAMSAGSGGNIDNALRQQFKSILNNPKKRRGFTNDEIAAMQLIVKGTKGQNLARLVGKMSPQGNGLMQLLQALGALGTGGASIPLAVAGTGAKILADKATPANVERLSQIVRSGGDASKLAVQPNRVQQFLERNKGGLTLPLAVGGILAAD